MPESQLQPWLYASWAALALVAVLYLRLRLRLAERVEVRLDEWRERELQGLARQLERAAEARARAQLERWLAEREDGIRKDAVSRSRGVVAGKVAEHLAPWLDGFPYNPKDARFLGSPVDLVVFDGLDEGALAEIVFVEVKTGAGVLSARERSIRDAVRAGRVRFEEFRPA